VLILSEWMKSAILSFLIFRMTLGYVSDHWAQYVSHNRGLELVLQPYSMEKLQIEFDELFLRAVLHVLKAKR
jgi:hypothetical protein